MPTTIANASLVYSQEESFELLNLATNIFLFSIFLMGVIVQQVIQLLKLPVPYTVTVFMLGMLFGSIPGDFLSMGPHLMLNIFMPILIFEGSFAMDVYVFRKIFWQSMLLAGPGLVIMIAMTAGVTQLLFRYEGWDWSVSLLFGAILSATDPVAVVALLKELGVSKQLSLLIEGESMLNDGTAMVVFNILYGILAYGHNVNALEITFRAIRISFGGPIFGYLVARIIISWLSRTFNDPLSEIIVTLLATYITYYIAPRTKSSSLSSSSSTTQDLSFNVNFWSQDPTKILIPNLRHDMGIFNRGLFIKWGKSEDTRQFIQITFKLRAEVYLSVSGVLALVVLGVVVGSNKTSISPEVEAFLHSFWETLAYLANTLIFFLVGMLIVRFVIANVVVSDFFYLVIIYVSVNCIRGVVLVMFSPIMSRLAYGLPWQYNFVATWSGLRGAVGLGLAFIVADTESPRLPKISVGYKILFHLSGVVFLTLVVNATTIAHLLAMLGTSGVSHARKTAMVSAFRFLAEVKTKTMRVWKIDRFLADVDWELVDKMSTMKDPFNKGGGPTPENEEEEPELRMWGVCPECGALVPYQPTTEELKEMTNDAIQRLIKAEKLSYWRQFEHGMLPREAVRKLTDMCEQAADTKGQFIDIDEIKKSWEDSFFTKLCERVKKLDLSEATVLTLPETPTHTLSVVFPSATGDIGATTIAFDWVTGPRMWNLHTILTNRCFIVGAAVVLFLFLDAPVTILTILWYFVLGPSTNLLALQIIDVVFLFLVAVYFTLRLIYLKERYIQSLWFWLSIFILIHGVADSILQFSIPQNYFPRNKEDFHDLVSITFIFFRLLRILHLTEALVPLLILYLEQLITFQLSVGYEIGRGFVMGEEEIRKLIDHMSERKDITEMLRAHSDMDKLEILKCLGLLHKQHPEVAMGVKTRQAIRSVLNDLRDNVSSLLQDGVLEKVEGAALMSVIESRMKKLLNDPPEAKLPSISKILQNVPWVEENRDLVQYIKERAVLTNYEYGQVLMRQGEPTTGISIILSGLVKLEIKMDNVGENGEVEEGTRILDFLTVGNVLGEMGVLTNKPRTATVVCETAVQVLNLSLEDIQKAFDLFDDLEPPLRYRLWRLGAIRLCTGLLMDQPNYQGLTKDKIRLLLESGYLMEIPETQQTFLIQYYTAADVVLVYGNAYDAYTFDNFVGPCYIPPNVTKLVFQEQPVKNLRPILFIVPPKALDDMEITNKRFKNAIDFKKSRGKSPAEISKAASRRFSLGAPKVRDMRKFSGVQSKRHGWVVQTYSTLKHTQDLRAKSLLSESQIQRSFSSGPISSPPNGPNNQKDAGGAAHLHSFPRKTHHHHLTERTTTSLRQLDEAEDRGMISRTDTSFSKCFKDVDPNESPASFSDSQMRHY